VGASPAALSTRLPIIYRLLNIDLSMPCVYSCYKFRSDGSYISTRRQPRTDLRSAAAGGCIDGSWWYCLRKLVRIRFFEGFGKRISCLMVAVLNYDRIIAALQCTVMTFVDCEAGQNGVWLCDWRFESRPILWSTWDLLHFFNPHWGSCNITLSK